MYRCVRQMAAHNWRAVLNRLTLLCKVITLLICPHLRGHYQPTKSAGGADYKLPCQCRGYCRFFFSLSELIGLQYRISATTGPYRKRVNLPLFEIERTHIVIRNYGCIFIFHFVRSLWGSAPGKSAPVKSGEIGVKSTCDV